MIIVGGGLSGLTLAYRLGQKVDVTLLEAASRLGGRIQTVKGTAGTPLEMGATWFADKHRHFSSLLVELGIPKFPQFSAGIALFQPNSEGPPQQFVAPEAEPSYRVAGGTQKLTDTLITHLDPQTLHLNTRVTTVTATELGVSVATADGRTWQADRVVICIPPQLAGSRITVFPELPVSAQDMLPTVQTWMAGSVKFALEYARPFWRARGFSGMLYSHAGLVTEMYDHNSFAGDKFGFTGFLQGSAARYSLEGRKENVLRQLSELFGQEAGEPLAYLDKVWDDEYILDGNPVIERPHQNNGHPLLRREYMNGKLLFCGTETASSFPGYMEGAVEAAMRVADRVQGMRP